MSADVQDGVDDDGQFELCNDSGFIYKLLRRRRRRASPPPSIAAADNDSDSEHRRRRRARRKKSLLTIRDHYRAELDLCERLSSSVVSAAPLPLLPQVDTSSAAARDELCRPTSRVPRHLLDDLYSQAEGHELSMQKLPGLCDYAESLCDTEEQRTAQDLLELPVWGIPKSLITSLSN